MPIAPTYPGVYIQEIPSGVRTIVGVATSITAFIGRAYQGPTNEPVPINSFGDFERAFGGLQEDYPLSYAVRDFYLNGGSQALIVRVVSPNFANDVAKKVAQSLIDIAQGIGTAIKDAKDLTEAKTFADAALAAIEKPGKSEEEKQAARNVVKIIADKVAAGVPLSEVKKAAADAVPTALPGKAQLPLQTTKQDDPLILEAASEGEWGNFLAAHIDYEGIDSIGDRYEPLTKDDMFNLTVRDFKTGKIERFLNLSVVKTSPRGIHNVLLNESSLIRVASLPASLGSKPNPTDNLVNANLKAIVVTGQGETATDEQKKAGADAQKKIDALALPFKPTDEFRYVGITENGSNGGKLTINDITEGPALQANKKGLYALEKTDLFNLLCIPPDDRGGDTDLNVYGSAMKYCFDRRAMLIVDSPANWSANKDVAAARAKAQLSSLNLVGEVARNAALFFPRVIQADPKRDGQLDTFVPCGIIAGIMARTDTSRGVWKAPAGLDATLNSIQGLEVNLNDAENGMLNPLGINCLRFFPGAGRVVWGARTLRGADQLADEYKYIPVRRLALFIEESLYRGTQWVVFEPNDEPLWAQIRLNIGAFMHNLFRQGAFQGRTPTEAYFVKCDKESTTQNDINLGIVNIVVGFAPLKPAEFVIISLQQMAGQIQT